MKKRVETFVLAMILLLAVCACAAPAPGESESPPEPELGYQDYYDLGVRYLSEGNYEEAIIAFTAAIEIEPRAEAYLGRGDAYVGAGETEENLAAALSDYEMAFSINQNLEITDKIYRIRGASALAEITADENGWYKIPDFFDGSKILIQPRMGGKDLEGKTFRDAVEYYGAIMEKRDDSLITATTGNVSIQQLMGSFQILYMAPNGHFTPTYEPEYLGIHFGDDFDQVLQILGITEAGAQYLNALNADYLGVSVFNSVPGVRIDTENWCPSIMIWQDWSNSVGWCQIYMYFDENGYLNEFILDITTPE